MIEVEVDLEVLLLIMEKIKKVMKIFKRQLMMEF